MPTRSTYNRSLRSSSEPRKPKHASYKSSLSDLLYQLQKANRQIAEARDEIQKLTADCPKAKRAWDMAMTASTTAFFALQAGMDVQQHDIPALLADLDGLLTDGDKDNDLPEVTLARLHYGYEEDED